MAYAAGREAKIGRERRLTVGQGGYEVVRPAPENSAEEAGRKLGPCHSSGTGGMETLTSSVSRATNSSTSPAS